MVFEPANITGRPIFVPVSDFWWLLFMAIFLRVSPWLQVMGIIVQWPEKSQVLLVSSIPILLEYIWHINGIYFFYGNRGLHWQGPSLAHLRGWAIILKHSKTFQNIPKNRKKGSSSLGKWVVANEAPEALPQGFFFFIFIFLFFFFDFFGFFIFFSIFF